MKPRHRISDRGLELIKRFEGLRTRAAHLPEGGWTIGHGHTASAREGAEITAEDAHALLLWDLREIVKAVNEWTFAPLTQNQFDALCAFAFNIGLPAFRGSNVLRRVNEGAMLQAAAALDSWRRAEFEGEPLVIDALVRRRAAEKTLFLTPPGGFVPAPSPVLRPEMDFALVHSLLSEPAVRVEPTYEGDEAGLERVDEPAPAGADSPAMSAAESIGRRLQALFPDEDEALADDEQHLSLEEIAPVAPEMEPAAETEAEPAPPEAEEQTAPEEVATEAEPWFETDAGEPVAEADPEAEAATAEEAVAEAEPATVEEAIAEAERSDYAEQAQEGPAVDTIEPADKAPADAEPPLDEAPVDQADDAPPPEVAADPALAQVEPLSGPLSAPGWRMLDGAVPTPSEPDLAPLPEADRDAGADRSAPLLLLGLGGLILFVIAILLPLPLPLFAIIGVVGVICVVVSVYFLLKRLGENDS